MYPYMNKMYISSIYVCVCMFNFVIKCIENNTVPGYFTKIINLILKLDIKTFGVCTGCTVIN